MNNDGFYKSLRRKIKEYLKSDEGKVNKYAEYILLVPDLFHLLCKLALEKEVNVADKAKLAVAIVYFISPVDLIHEAIVGPPGYVDDIVVAAFVINSIINNTNPEVVIRNWVGEEDILLQIQELLKVADNMLGSGVLKKIKGMLNID